MSKGSGMILVIAGPSGAGKGTVEDAIMEHFKDIRFSVSVTTRPKRDYEEEGVHYFFISREDFQEKIRGDELVEWEEVFSGNGHLYGTLRSHIDDALTKGKVILLDIDIKGGLNVKQAYPEQCLSIFIQPPSVAELEKRLIHRGTDSPEQIKIRMARMPEEMELGKQFDHQIVNDDLQRAVQEVIRIIEEKVYANKGVNTWD